jgi:uncharacterized RDD family membrane protein YckC
MEQQENLLDELHEQQNLMPVSGGKRFANYLIDVVAFYIFAMAIGFIYFMINPDAAYEIQNSRSDPMDGLAGNLLSLLLYALFMGAQEAIFKGRSIGKFITSTRAVNIDGSMISVQTAFTRGLSRAVPFCVFSALGTPCHPWQDSWTDTVVVEEKNRVII